MKYEKECWRDLDIKKEIESALEDKMGNEREFDC